MAVAGRAVSTSLDTFELMLYRSCVGALIVSVFIIATGRRSDISFNRPGLHLIRNAAHFTGQNLWFFALTILPLAQVFALEFTSPLWVAALAPFLLGERLTAVRVLAALLGFCGILMIALPGSSAPGNLTGILIAALSAVCFALTAIFTRKLTRTETTPTILLWLTFSQLVFGLICSGWDLDVTLPDWQTLPWVVLIGCAGLLAHTCLTQALSLAPASVVIPIDFARLPVIAVIGAVFYGEEIGVMLVIGAVVIIFANLTNLRYAQKAR